MAKDLIIGGASNYNWDHLKYWVNSIRKTGFKGDVVLIATNMSGETVKKLNENGVNVYAYGKRTPDGGIAKTENNIPPHVERFLFIWDYLRKNKDTYRYVVVTDTRDVIFQKDPTEFLKAKLLAHSLVCASEGLLYKNEPWGNKNLLDTFGSMLYDDMRDNMIYNVGTIAGYCEEVRDLLLQIFFQSVNRPIPIVDQAVFNFLISLHPFKDEVMTTTNSSCWAAQLGVTRGAIEAGAGDIGMSVKQDPSLLERYLELYQDEQPTIDGASVKMGNEEFYLVHQWDRIPALKAEVEKKYG